MSILSNLYRSALATDALHHTLDTANHSSVSSTNRSRASLHPLYRAAALTTWTSVVCHQTFLARRLQVSCASYSGSETFGSSGVLADIARQLKQRCHQCYAAALVFATVRRRWRAVSGHVVYCANVHKALRCLARYCTVSSNRCVVVNKHHRIVSVHYHLLRHLHHTVTKPQESHQIHYKRLSTKGHQSRLTTPMLTHKRAGIVPTILPYQYLSYLSN